MGANAEVARRGGHGSVIAPGVSARGVPTMCPSIHPQIPALTIDYRQQGYGWTPSRSSPVWTDLFRDHSAYRIEPPILTT